MHEPQVVSYITIPESDLWSIFVGKYSPEAMGDYLAGPNHVLPTTGSAKFSSGLSVFDFLKRQSLIKISKTGIERLGPYVINLAKYEFCSKFSFLFGFSFLTKKRPLQVEEC